MSGYLVLSSTLAIFQIKFLHHPKLLSVLTNGIIAVSEPSVEDDYLGQFPLNFGGIAPFYADLDTTGGQGRVYYREDSSPDILQLAVNYIKRCFPESTFEPSSVVIVTWDSVAPYAGPGEDATLQAKRNTFQAVLASSDSSSYAIFLYPEDGLQFYSTHSKNDNELVPATVGFSQPATNYYLWIKPGLYKTIANEEETLNNLHRSSNLGKQGVWAFEIGGSDIILPTSESPVSVDYGDYDQFQEVTTEPPISHKDSIEISQPEVSYEIPSRGDNIQTSYSIPQPAAEDDFQSPYQTATEQPPPEPPLPTGKNPPLQFPAQQFPQQHGQIIDVEEVDETGIVFRYSTDVQQTCANNRHQCSVHAVCKDYPNGFCCSCITGYKGNGRQCVAEGSPQRVNGKVKGRIFVGNNPIPIVFENTDLHSYVVMNHGRAYTAISTIPETLGFSLLPLAPIGGVIGWMFAVEQQGYKNGFSITGGEFTRQAEVTFLNTNEKLTIKQKFSGIDEHGHLTIDTQLEGKVPEIPFGSSVHIEPYTELYHSSSSVITSSSTREYTVTEPERGGTSPTYTVPYQWRQTISFDECIYDDSHHPVSATQQLSVDSIFVLYNTDEQILRYAMSNSIGPIGEGRSHNPCYTGTHGCDTNAVCRPGANNQFTCECSVGFRGDGRTCYELEKTKCQREQEQFMAFGPRGPRPVGQFIPQCDVYGNYLPTQCHSSSGYCWCVDRDGNEIDGTRSGPGIQPPCIGTVAPPVVVGPSVKPDTIHLPPGTHLLIAQSGRIDHVPLEGNDMRKQDAKALLYVPDKVVIGVAYDCLEKMVYWTDISSPSISRASLGGGEPVAIIKTDLESPEGIALDYLGRTIFWTDSQLDRIEVARVDGTQRRILFDTDLVNPRAIVADPMRGNLYWTDWNREAPKIETSYMDGTNRRILVKDDLGLPNGLTFDTYSSLLCWVDAGTKRLECMDPNQLGRRKILEGIQYPFSITSYGKNLFYTDWKRDAVVAVDRTVPEENDNFQPPKRTRIYGITTALAQCPQGHNYCSVNNGGCTHLCLATPGGRSCRCPDNTVGVDCTERN
uniref:Nidogen 1 n=1 Tax=Anolis carolinensis TaxID=28377 RepID=A0A803SR35_ANOCA